MNKQEFLQQLEKGLSGLPQTDREERLNFYSEMIDDRIEEGLSEESAVADIGSSEEIISQIIGETPMAKLVKERIQPKRKLAVWEIVLLILGSPIWVSLIIAAITVVLSVYISLWAVTAALWAVFAALAVVVPGGIATGIIFFSKNGLTGFAFICAAVVSAGLAIFMFLLCRLATKTVIILTKKITLFIKKCFAGKEAS